MWITERYLRNTVLIPWLPLLIASSTVHITVHPDKTIRAFDPGVAFGGAIDGHEVGENAYLRDPRSIKDMLAAGLRPVSFRLRTELAGEAWHWNPEGSWSDPVHHQGYWTGNPKPDKPIEVSYGYRLPRRGNTTDQANDDGYSRLDDGDPNTFWKSNPYLDPCYTGQSYQTHPQWVVVDLGDRKRLNQMVIRWGEPHAESYRVRYWSGEDEDEGAWTPAPEPRSGSGFPPSARLGFRVPSRRQTVGTSSTENFVPFRAQYVQILLLRSSGDGAKNGGPPNRDRLGFAIREISLGREDHGVFHDEIHHGKHGKQTDIFVSSTDPWHREEDIDKRVEQPGFDLFFKSAIAKGKSVMMPAGALYDTPENVRAEMEWLKARGDVPSSIELGEEPDGQGCAPEDFGELYLQAASAVRDVFPRVQIGGPSFQDIGSDFAPFPLAGGTWYKRFRLLVNGRRRAADLNFTTVEWYPFDNVRKNPSEQLLHGPELMRKAIQRMKSQGMDRLPWDVTEYGYSVFGAEAEVDLPGAIFDFETPLLTLELGGRTSYLYGYEPGEPIQEVHGQWGNNMILEEVEGKNMRMPTFYAAWLLTHVLCRAGGCSLLGCSGDNEQVGCYAVRRGDGTFAVALLNREPGPARVDLAGFQPSHRWTYGSAQYHWHAAGENGRPDRDLGPAEDAVTGHDFTLPGYSITVLE